MLLAAVAVRALRIDTSFNKTLPVRHVYMRTYLDPKVAEFRGANRVLIALIARDGNMFTPSSSPRCAGHRRSDRHGWHRPHAGAVDLHPNVRYLEVVEDGIEAGNVIPADFTPTAANMARRARQHPQGRHHRAPGGNDFSGALVSAIVLDQDAQGKRSIRSRSPTSSN